MADAPLQEAWLVRHAETEWSRTHRHTGRTDVPLTDHGRDRARMLATRIDPGRFALVLCSPLARARETAQLVGLGAAAQPREDLLEWDYGEYEGITTKEIRSARPGWFLWRDGAPGGESPEQVGARCDRIVDEILATAGDVAVVAHGHVLRVLAARWLEEAPAFGGRLFLDTGALCTLGFERETRVLRRWNETAEDLAGGEVGS